MKKNFLAISTILLLAAGCNIFGGGSNLLGSIKTIDGGSTWLPVNKIENDAKNSLAGVSVTEMMFSPTTRNTIFLSTIAGGIWKSEDSGSNWKLVLSKVTVYDFFINPQNADEIYAAGIFNDHGKIVHTYDGGKTWEELYNEASAGNAVNTITANPNNTSEIYAALNSGVMIKSTDAGRNWFVLQQYKEQLLKMRYNNLNNSLYALLRNQGVLKSTDGGRSWNVLTTALTETSNFSVESFISAGAGKFIKLALDDQAAGVMYITSENGIYKSVNDGASWEHLSIPIKRTEVNPRAIASTKSGMLAYTSIGSTIFKTLDGGKSWQTQSIPSTAIVNKILIDPVLPQITYAGLLDQ